MSICYILFAGWYSVQCLTIMDLFPQNFMGIVLRGRSQTTLTRFWLFLTTYPPMLTFSMVWTLTKSGHFWTTYLPRLVNVVCERSLTVDYWKKSEKYFLLVKFVDNDWVQTANDICSCHKKKKWSIGWLLLQTTLFQLPIVIQWSNLNFLHIGTPAVWKICIKTKSTFNNLAHNWHLCLHFIICKL